MTIKFIPKLVTIRPCNLSLGYFYKNECFAYVWAVEPFSKDWWMNLLLMADKHPQDLIQLGEKLKKSRSASKAISKA
jgi:hypothetical protein